MRSMFLRAAAFALALFAMPRAADAGWMGAYTGNTQTGYLNTMVNGNNNSGNADGVINFAVWDNTDGSFSTFLANNSAFASALNFGFGNTTVFTNTKYLYFYQVVNSDPVQTLQNDRFLDSLFLSKISGNHLTTAGWANGFVFKDPDGNAVGPTGNQRLGDEGTDTDHALNGIPSQVNIANFANTSFVANASAKSITGWDADTSHPNSNPAHPSDGSDAYQFGFDQILTNQFTSIMILGANAGPQYHRGSDADGANSFGDVPVPGPEPTTIALFGMALPLLGFRYLRRQKTKAEPAIA